MTMPDGFHPVAEVTADECARIAAGQAGASQGDRYAVLVNDEGAILLVPVASIPKRELFVWNDDQLRGVSSAVSRMPPKARPGEWTGRPTVTMTSECATVRTAIHR